MPLIFISGPVSCGKTTTLIIEAYQLQKIAKENNVQIWKPSIDTRNELHLIKSASGLQIKLTHLMAPDTNLLSMNLKDVKYIFIDEIQFFTVDQISQLREISLTGIFVFCYGLITDYKLCMFETSKKLLELCDKHKYHKSFCTLCKEHNHSTTKYATHNLRINKVGDRIIPIFEGESICIGGIETFIPTCYQCYVDSSSKSNDVY